MSLFQGLKYFLLSDKSKQKTLRKILGFYPSNYQVYDQAFTHKSIVNEDQDSIKISNERLEFLGDAILGAVIAEYFFLRFPYEDEGFLTKGRSKLVSRSFLNQLSIDIGLDTFIETSPNIQRSKSIFGDAFEALIGAIYIDKGYVVCRKFLNEKVIQDYVDVERLINTETNFKSKLIEWSQSKKRSYEFVTKQQEDSGKRYFYSELLIESERKTVGEGNSKKRAEQAAARRFMTSEEVVNKP